MPGSRVAWKRGSSAFFMTIAFGHEMTEITKPKNQTLLTFASPRKRYELEDAPMKKTRHITSYWLVSALVMVFLAWPTAAVASSIGIQGIDNLAFLFEEGSDSRPGTPSDLKDQVYRFDLQGGETNPLIGLTGSYEFTYLGYEAGNTNTLNANSGTIFENKTSFTQHFTRSPVDLGSAFFDDTIDGPTNIWLTGTSNLDIYQIEGTYLNAYTQTDWFEVGITYYVVGFGDGLGDQDYDDLVVAIKGPMHTPLPSAVLLLGSGLLGLMGFGLRGRQKTKA